MTKSQMLHLFRALVKELTDGELIVKAGDVTELDFENDTITLNLDGTEPDLGFMRHLREVHKEHHTYEVDERIWAVLHEVGHYMTVDDLCEGYEEEEEKPRALCALLTTEEVAASPKLQDLYFNLPSEWEATEWACEVVESDLKKYKELTALLQ